MKETATMEEIKMCKCCYNCKHWNKDYTLMYDYLYNSCKENDKEELIMSPAGWCCTNFTNKTMKELLPNVFGYGS